MFQKGMPDLLICVAILFVQLKSDVMKELTKQLVKIHVSRDNIKILKCLNI